MIGIFNHVKEAPMLQRITLHPLLAVAFTVASVSLPALRNAACEDSVATKAVEATVSTVVFSHQDIEGLEHERGIVRRDPSDVIKAGNTCYVYYSKVVKAELPANKRHLGGSG